MAVVRMAGVSLVGPRDEIEAMALRLLEAGDFEPMSPEVMLSGGRLSSRIRACRSGRCDALLEKLERLRGLAGTPAPAPGRRAPDGASGIPSSAISFTEVSFSELEERVNRLSRLAEVWRARLEHLRMEHGRCRAMLEFAHALEALGLPPSLLASSSCCRVVLGSLTGENWQRLREIASAGPALLLPLFEDEGRTTVAAFCESSYGAALEKLLTGVHMRVFETAIQELAAGGGAQLSARLDSLEAEIGRCRDMPVLYTGENRVELERLYGMVYAMQRVYSLCRMGGEFDDMAVVSGWMPEEACGELRALAGREAPHTVVLMEDGASLESKGGELPTLLRNAPVARRFQEIVRLYSLPSYSELDPTLVVSVSFCLFFGFMFGDVGHGLALILGTWLMERRGWMGRALASVMKVAGASAVLFGILYGSVFGSEELIPPLWISPMKHVNTLLPTAVGVGIAFLSLGILLRIRSLARRRRWGEAVFSPEGGAGLAFYWLALAFGVLSLEGTLAPWESRIFIAALLLLLCAMLLGNVLARRVFRGESVDEGGAVHLFSVFHALLNFIGNTASFVRLAAFALNHAGLCAAVFMLGQMVEHVPGGKVLHALVLVVGHLVIIGLEGLIVFIQTLRLEYYEFFGKFYHGGGREFRPVLWRRSAQERGRAD